MIAMMAMELMMMTTHDDRSDDEGGHTDGDHDDR